MQDTTKNLHDEKLPTNCLWLKYSQLALIKQYLQYGLVYLCHAFNATLTLAKKNPQRHNSIINTCQTFIQTHFK